LNGKICRLCDIECGEKAQIISHSDSGELKKRLSDMGFIPGTNLECIMKSPLGDPSAFLIRGAVVALRRDDSKYINVEVIT
jgi:ferrous iron transport protein A